MRRADRGAVRTMQRRMLLQRVQLPVADLNSLFLSVLCIIYYYNTRPKPRKYTYCKNNTLYYYYAATTINNANEIPPYYS